MMSKWPKPAHTGLLCPCRVRCPLTHSRGTSLPPVVNTTCVWWIWATLPMSKGWNSFVRESISFIPHVKKKNVNVLPNSKVNISTSNDSRVKQNDSKKLWDLLDFHISSKNQFTNPVLANVWENNSRNCSFFKGLWSSNDNKATETAESMSTILTVSLKWC